VLGTYAGSLLSPGPHGSTTLGLRRSIITYLVVVFVYLPYILVVWHCLPTFVAEDLLRTLLFGVFGLIPCSHVAVPLI